MSDFLQAELRLEITHIRRDLADTQAVLRAATSEAGCVRAALAEAKSELEFVMAHGLENAEELGKTRAALAESKQQLNEAEEARNDAETRLLAQLAVLAPPQEAER